MTSSRSIGVIAHDIGGARAVIPVVKELENRGSKTHAFVSGPAAQIWANECARGEFTVVADCLSHKDAVDLLKKKNIDMLLSASGLYNQIEHTFRKASESLGHPIVAVLDSWLNYRERFERLINGRIDKSWPTLVCAIDNETKDGMIDAGFNPNSVLVSGPANLEASQAFTQHAEAQYRRQWREKKGIANDSFVLVFFSDPFYLKPDGRPFSGVGGLTDDNGRSLFGYVSTETLDALLNEAHTVFSNAKRPLHVLVKPHPLEDPRPLKSIINKHTALKVTLVEDENALFWIVVADAILGMMSIALLEGALAGKPSISVEFNFPASGAEEPCRSNLMGYTQPIYERSGLRPVLDALCNGTYTRTIPPANKRLPIVGAASRIADEVCKKMGDVKIA